MKKGIVMEIEDAFLLLLTPEGEFMRAKKQNQPYAIGEEIYFFPIDNQYTSPSRNLIKGLMRMKPMWAVLAALLIFLGSYIPVYQSNKAYAYMSIDVNPSIELGVNKKMQVVELNGFNQDGKKVISHLHQWMGKDVSDLTQTILAEMRKEGYLTANKQVIISTVRIKPAEMNVEDKLNADIKKIKATTDKEHLALKVLNGTEKEREKAHQLGMTTGKYQENKIQSSNVKGNLQTDSPNKKQEQKPRKNASPAKQTLPPGQLKKQIKTVPSQDGEKKGKENVKSHKKSTHNFKKKSINPSKKKSNEKHESKLRHKWKSNYDWNHWNGWNQTNDRKKLEVWNNQPLYQWDKSTPKKHSKQH